ncbi:type II secretion system protein GspE, partial [Candidatus Parcubacteria bacterium]|nr:type II secretion system protein GspE [Candidatus Parcubacteria bacterium]
LYKGAGCQYCANTGYSGRIAIAEVLDINNQIQEIIIDQKKVFKMEDIRNSQKFISIKQNGIIKVLQGLTTWEEILRVVYD